MIHTHASTNASKKCLLTLKILLLKLYAQVRLIVLVIAIILAGVLCCHASNNVYS